MAFALYAFEDQRWANLCVVDSQIERTSLFGDIVQKDFKITAKNASFLESVRQALLEFPGKDIIVVRNPYTQLTETVLEAASKFISEPVGPWSILSGFGLGINSERFIAHYSAQDPILSFQNERRLILDSSPDVYLLNSNAVRGFLEYDIDAASGFEPLLVQFAMKTGRQAWFDPKMGCAINGHFLARDEFRIRQELSENAAKIGLKELRTLSGNFEVPSSIAAKLGGRKPDEELLRKDIQELLVESMTSVVEPFTLSIVVRTMFRRVHLLHRLLASITRSLVSSVPVQVVLSSDCQDADAVAGFASVKARFPNLDLTLAHHNKELSPHMASRVRNLLLGLGAASHEYVWFIDDDDYVDPLACKRLAHQLYGGVRPIFFAAAGIHEEVWEANNTKAVVSHTRRLGCWAADGWRTLFLGVNKVPVCGIIAPKVRVMAALSSLPMRFNLSEDYAMHLAILLEPDLPPIVEIQEELSHISMRDDQDTTMNAKDRAGWCSDIFGFLQDLFYHSKARDRSLLRLVAAVRTSPPPPGEEVVALRRTVQELQQKNAVLNRQLSILSSALQSQSTST
ncbi:MAG: glycosyltransferase [Aquidulcibacter sp.]|nr:glycosyltransferase [Aquidulcibacter sp.]